MKESSCYIDGLFYYSGLYQEVRAIRAEVEDLTDELLVDEVAYLCEDNDVIDAIMYDFFTMVRLTEEKREQLIWFYVVCMIEDYLVIDEEGEY
jgi:hypothetical protein